MGWRDESTPIGAAPAPTDASASGWRSGSTPIGGGPPQASPQAPPTSAWGSETSTGDALQDYGRIAANSFGVGDRAIAGWHTILPAMFPKLFGGNATGPIATDAATLDQQNQAALQAERDKTAAATTRAGAIPSAVANAVGYLPAVAVTGGIGAGFGGGVMAGAAEQAALGALAATGRGENVAQGTIGGAVGGAGGGLVSKYAISPLVNAVGTKVGRAVGMLSDPEAATAEAQAAEKAAWAPTKTTQFSRSDVNPAYDSALNSLEKNQLDDVSGTFMSRINGQRSSLSTPTSASDIDGFQRNLANAASSPGEKVLAARIGDNLDSVLARGGALDDVQAGRFASQQAKAAGNLQDWSQQLADPLHTSPAAAAYNTANQFYTRGSPQYNDLLAITKAAAPGGMTSYAAERALGPLVESAGLAAGGPAVGMGAEMATQLARPALGGLFHLMQRNRIQDTISQAYPSLTGMAASRANLATPTGALIKSLMLGSTGGYQDIGPGASYLPSAVRNQ